MATALQQLLHRLRDAARKAEAPDLLDSELMECFVAVRDEAAFELLVRRHGPMVYGVCRRILGNDADAEDAFQATFLVLVRKAASIRPRGMVSNWLYGVAHNTALKAKAMIHQRQRKEHEAGTMPKSAQSQEVWEQVQSLVDIELSGLPEKYRVPIVLCDLEGKSIKEATHDLGWPQGTLASRLTRGRALLARRLTKHGLQLSAGILAGVLGQSAAQASVPATLTSTTIQAGCLLAAGKTAAAAGVSAAAIALSEGVLKTMLLVKLKLAVASLLVVTMLGAGVGYLLYSRSTGNDALSRYSSVARKVEGASVRQQEEDLAARSTSNAESPDASCADEAGKLTPPRVIVLRSQDLGASEIIPPHHSTGEHSVKVRTVIRLNSNGAAGSATANAKDKDKHKEKLAVVMQYLSAHQMMVIVQKGKCYLLDKDGKIGRAFTGESYRLSPDSLRQLPDGTRLILIRIVREAFPDRDVLVELSSAVRQGAPCERILDASGAAEPTWFHAAP